MGSCRSSGPQHRVEVAREMPASFVLHSDSHLIRDSPGQLHRQNFLECLKARRTLLSVDFSPSGCVCVCLYVSVCVYVRLFVSVCVCASVCFSETR